MAGKRAWLPILVASGLVATAVWTLRSDSSRFAIARDYARLERVWSEHWPLDRGKGALLRAAPLLSSIGVIPVRAELEPGVRLLLDPRDIIERAILRDGQWEPAVWRAISGNLRDGAVFLDAGAHIGYFSIRSAVRVGKSGRVVAFEPNPKTLTRLRENVTASDAANVSIQPIACTDREQVVTLYEGPADNTGTTSLSKENAGAFASRRKPAGSSFVVRGRRIDDVVRELGFERVDVMKVDVEGAEYYALRGALETLKRFRPQLVVEIIPRQLGGMQSKVEDIVSLVEGVGYSRSREISRSVREWTAQ